MRGYLRLVVVAVLFFLLILPDVILSFTTYPMYPVVRYSRSGHVPVSYIPLPRYPDYRSDYDDDDYVQADDPDYFYDRYSRSPVYSYYPPSEEEVYGYARRDPVGDFDEDEQREYPYGQETWFEGETSEDAAANAAFMQNVMLAQMYHDAAAEAYPSGYAEEWSDTGDVARADDADNGDEDVRELESLKAKAKAAKAEMKAKAAETERRPLSKDEIFRNMQKQMEKAAAKKYTKSKKQVYGKYRYDGNALGSRSDRKSVGLTTTTAAAPVTTERAATTAPASMAGRVTGQKEFVLPRPASPVRRPFEVEARSGERRPSVYDTIKKLLTMEEGLRQMRQAPRLQKRYVLSDDQLTSQMSGLKKVAV